MLKEWISDYFAFYFLPLPFSPFIHHHIRSYKVNSLVLMYLYREMTPLNANYIQNCLLEFHSRDNSCYLNCKFRWGLPFDVLQLPFSSVLRIVSFGKKPIQNQLIFHNKKNQLDAYFKFWDNHTRDLEIQGIKFIWPYFNIINSMIILLLWFIFNILSFEVFSFKDK